jgi:hypothetical protein
MPLSRLALVVLGASAALGACSDAHSVRLGPGNCSGSELLGRWRQTMAIDTGLRGGFWLREDLELSDDCSIRAAEYEGLYRSDSGFWRQDGQAFMIDMEHFVDSIGTVVEFDSIVQHTTDGYRITAERW